MENIDYLNKIGELIFKNFDISLSDIPLPKDLVPIDDNMRGDGLLVGSKEALKYQNIVQGDITNFFSNTPAGYFLIGFWGHGFNSYAFYYCRIDSRSKIFFRLPYGGAYMKNKKEAKRIGKFLPEFFDFEKKLNNKWSFKALESMGKGSYRFYQSAHEFKFESIYNSTKENKFDEILEKLGIGKK